MTGIRSHLVATAAYAAVVTRNVPDFKPYKKKYGALAHKLPGLVLQNGLAQATGFLLAKGKEEHLALLSDMSQVLHATGATVAGNGRDLHAEIIGADLGDTMRLTRRTLEASGWIKRYVQGVLGVDATGDAVAETHDGGAEGT